MNSAIRRVSLALAAGLAIGLTASLTSVAMAQTCEPRWIPGSGIPGVEGQANAVATWDPDGDGPLPTRIAVAGSFQGAGSTYARSIAIWNGTEWTECGIGLNEFDSINTLLYLPNGDLLVGGSFTLAPGAGVFAKNIARWNGTSWSALNQDHSTGPVLAMCLRQNGDLVIAGVRMLRRLDGNFWSPLAGAGMAPQGTVYDLAEMPNGDLVIGGAFNRVGLGFGYANIASFDGTTWSNLGGGIVAVGAQPVRTLTVLPEGTLAVGGRFSSAGGVAAENVARWDGNAWTAFGPGLTGGSFPAVDSLTVLGNGNLVAGGLFSSTGATSVNNIAEWNGSEWTALDTGADAQVVGVAPIGEAGAAAVGLFTRAGDAPVRQVAAWDGSEWSSLGGGTTSSPTAFENTLDGDLLAGGSFTMIGGLRTRGIACWNGVEWSPLGGGDTSPAPDSLVASILQLSSGDVIAGGTFTSMGGVAVDRVARWDGTAWTPLGEGLNGRVSLLEELPNGDIVAAGEFNASGATPLARIARWDGTAWRPMGDGFNAGALALELLPGGDLVAGGSFTMSGTQPLAYIARWTGSAWDPMNSPLTQRLHALEMRGDDLIVGGFFDTTELHHIASWNNGVWSPLGAGLDTPLQDLEILPDGDVVVTRIGREMARWDGTTWSVLSGGYLNDVYTLHVTSEGELIASGLEFLSLRKGPLATDIESMGFMPRWTESNGPWTAIDPEPATIEANSVLQLAAAPATGYENVSYHWLRNGMEITNGEGGASAGGGTVSGAFGTLESPTAGGRAVLTITGVRQSDAGEFSVVFSNDCGDDTSLAATVTVTCPADFDNSGQIDFFDYLDFVQAFANEDPRADFDNNGQVDFFDYLDFVTAFDAGC